MSDFPYTDWQVEQVRRATRHCGTPDQVRELRLTLRDLHRAGITLSFPEPRFYAEPSLFAGSTTWGVHDREVRGQFVLFMFDDEGWNAAEAEALAARLNREVSA